MFRHRHHCCHVRICRYLDVGWLSFVVSHILSMLVVIVIAVVSHWHALFIADWYKLKSYLLLSIIYKSAHDYGEYLLFLLSTCNMEMEFRHVLQSKWCRCSSGNSIVDIPLQRWRRRQRQRRRWQRWWWQWRWPVSCIRGEVPGAGAAMAAMVMVDIFVLCDIIGKSE